MTSQRFEVVEKSSLGFGGSVVILRDKDTGVHYLMTRTGYAGGLTPLLDKTGKPVIR